MIKKTIFTIAASLFIYIAFSVAFPARGFAMTTPVFAVSGAPGSVSASVTEYIPFVAKASSWQTTVGSNDSPIAIAGVISNMRVTIVTAPSSGKSWTWTLYKNAAATSLTVTISDTGLTAVDSTHTVAVAPGDLLAWEMAPTGTPTAMTALDISATFKSAVRNESFLVAGSENGGSIQSNSATNYAGIQGHPQWNATEANVSSLMPTSGTLDRFYAELQALPATGRSYTFTVYKNGAPTSMAVTISDSGVRASDLTHSISFVAGDTISIESVPSGTPTQRALSASFRIIPTIPGESILTSMGKAPSATATRYFTNYGWNTDGATTDDTATQARVPVAALQRKLYTSMSTAAGASKSRTSSSRKNTAAGNLTATMSGASATTASDVSHSDSLVADDLISFSLVPASTPATVTWYKIATVLYIPPETIKDKASSDLNLVAYYSFDDGTASQATDFSGHGNTGTLTNMESADWVIGKRSKALSFDGVDEYVTGGTAGFNTGTSARTISGWVKSNTSSAVRVPFVYGTCGPGNDGKAFGVYIDTVDSLHFWGCGTADYDTAVTVTENIWHYIAVTYDGTNVQVYLDGATAGSATARTLGSSTAFFEVGGANLLDSGNYYFPGLVDEVRVYARARTAAGVLALYNVGAAKVNAAQNSSMTTGLVGLWSFNGQDLTMTTATDRAGSNNGTLTNGPAPAAGKVGQGLKFDGVDDYVTMGDALALNGVQARTLSTWVKFNSDPLTKAEWLIERSNTANATYWLWWNGDNSFSLGDNTLICGHRNGGGSGEQVANTWTPSVNIWYHVACVYDGTQIIEYVDGAQLGSVGSYSGSVTDDAGGSVTLQLGRRVVTAASYLDGALDEVRIYNLALTAAQVKSLYNLGR